MYFSGCCKCHIQLLANVYIRLILHFLIFFLYIQIFDRLCQNFNGDVLQTLFNSTEGLASCPPENRRIWVWRFIFDEALAMGASNILHLLMIISFISIMEIYVLVILLIYLFGSLTIHTCSFFHIASSGNYFIYSYCCSQ